MRKLLLLVVFFGLLTGLTVVSAQDTDEDTAQESINRLAYIGFIEEMWREHNVALWDQFIAPDFIYHADAGDLTSDEERESYLNEAVGFIPDLSTSWYTTLADGDRVISPYVVTGTCPAEAGFPSVTCDWYGLDVMRAHDGKLVEYWSLIDSLYLFREMGFVPGIETQPVLTEALVAKRGESATSRAENKALVQQALDQFVSGDAADVFAADLVVHLPVSLYAEPVDLAGYQDFAASYQQAYPGFTLTPREDLAPGGFVADANLVTYMYTFTGTFSSEFRGITPTNAEVSFPGWAIFRVADGKIAEIWHFWDAYTELSQMQPTDA